MLTKKANFTSNLLAFNELETVSWEQKLTSFYESWFHCDNLKSCVLNLAYSWFLASGCSKAAAESENKNLFRSGFQFSDLISLDQSAMHIRCKLTHELTGEWKVSIKQWESQHSKHAKGQCGAYTNSNIQKANAKSIQIQTYKKLMQSLYQSKCTKRQNRNYINPKSKSTRNSS